MQNGGLRTNGMIKKTTDEFPLITVITVVYNGESTLEQTIISVVNQSYTNIEYIIIDGGSKDRTIDIIKKYEDKIDYWQSEPDNGIYDAMNKGIILASGEWINFMNSGDSFFQVSTISDCFMNKSFKDVDVIYGDSNQIDGNKKIYCPSGNNSNLLYRGPCYRHGASFVKTEVHKKNLFDISRKDLGYALDFNLIYSLKCQGFIFKKLPMIIINYDKEGVSNNLIKGATYIYKITKNRNPIRATLYLFIRKLKYYFGLYK